MKVIRINTKQQPQFKVSDLKRLPFCLDITSSFFDKIVNLSPMDRNQIDLIIYDIFQLNSQDIDEIEYFVSSLSLK